MGWLTQPYFDDGLEKGRAEGRAQGRTEGRTEGMAQGRTEGMAQGRTEGEAKSLVRLLEKRFGALPEPLRAQVFEADVQSLDAWLDRVFDAPDLQAVFGELDTVSK